MAINLSLVANILSRSEVLVAFNLSRTWPCLRAEVIMFASHYIYPYGFCGSHWRGRTLGIWTKAFFGDDSRRSRPATSAIAKRRYILCRKSFRRNFIRYWWRCSLFYALGRSRQVNHREAEAQTVMATARCRAQRSRLFCRRALAWKRCLCN